MSQADQIMVLCVLGINAIKIALKKAHITWCCLKARQWEDFKEIIMATSVIVVHTHKTGWHLRFIGGNDLSSNQQYL